MFAQLNVKHEWIPTVEEFKAACEASGVELDPLDEVYLIQRLNKIIEENNKDQCSKLHVGIIKDGKRGLVDGLITGIKSSAIHSNCVILLDDKFLEERGVIYHG